MGKPFGLLQRIFSISRASKRSTSGRDPPSIDEHGNDNDADDVLTSSVRTSGGIGGLGRGITNTPSEIGRSRTTSTSAKRSEPGLKNRRLRRASLSASNLLSWVQDKSSKQESRVTSASGIEGPQPPIPVDFAVSDHHDLTKSRQELSKAAGSNHLESDAIYNTLPYSQRFVEGLAHSSGSGKRSERGSSLRLPPDEQGDLTRVLRNSSSNYKILSKSDFRDLGPLEHPINDIATNQASEFQATRSPTNPPSAWPSPPHTSDVYSVPVHFPSMLMHAPSVSSATTTSTYRVTVHRRRIHSRTSFPEANRAFDHLHSSSPISASSTPSVSARSSSETLETQEAALQQHKEAHSPRQQSAIPRLVLQPTPRRNGNETTKFPKNDRRLSLLPRRASKGDMLAVQDLGPELASGVRYKDRRSTPANSQLFPVTPLMTVPPISRRGTSTAVETVLRTSIGKGCIPTQPERLSIRPVYSHDQHVSKISVVESVVRYTTALKQEEDADIQSQGGRPLGLQGEQSDAISLATGSMLGRSPAAKPRNVLRKKKRESQTSLRQSREDKSFQALSLKSGQSLEVTPRDSQKHASKSNLRSVLDVLHAVEGVMDRLHASAVGEPALISPQKPLSKETHTPTKQRREGLPYRSPSVTAPLSLSRHKSQSSHIPVPKRELSLSADPTRAGRAKGSTNGLSRSKKQSQSLRKDPSVASLLELYGNDGNVREDAFSNTPPTRLPQRSMSERGFVWVRKPNQHSDIGEKLTKPPTLETRSAQIRRTYAQASHISPLSSLDHSSSLATEPANAENNSQVAIHKQALSVHGERRNSPPRTVMVKGMAASSGFTLSCPPPSQRHFERGLAADISSSSSELSENIGLINASLFVEPGSIPFLDTGSCESSPVLETPKDEGIRMFDGNNIPTSSQANSTSAVSRVSHSSNRRASEVFGFLDEPRRSDESFEVGCLSDLTQENRREIIWLSNGATDFRPSRECLGHSVTAPSQASTRDSSVSPYRRPTGPRLGTSTAPQRSLAKGVSPLNLSLNGSASFGHTVPFTNATHTSDSFASQNTTDRSLYRGIYRYLNDTASNTGHTKLLEDMTDAQLHLAFSGEHNPFLMASPDVEKSIPITPSSSSSSKMDSASPIEAYNCRRESTIPLLHYSPTPPPILNKEPTFSVGTRRITPPSPSINHLKGSVKAKVAMWESSIPPPRPNGGPREQSSLKNHRPSVSFAAESLANGKGLGDGNNFNVNQAGSKKMFGPRKRVNISLENPSASVSSSSRKRQPTLPVGHSKEPETPLIYPFSQDLFPAILTPTGPSLVKPSSHLQTPHKASTQNDPSPASSSKLGVYGREIMALARSKSGQRGSIDSGKLL